MSGSATSGPEGASEAIECTFTGWPTDTQDWFTRLEANNNPDWFARNKRGYDAVEAATRALLQSWQADGGGDVKIFRLRRDARFSRGQAPFKTYHHAGVMRPDGIVESFIIDAHAIAISVGHPSWDTQQLARARAALRDPKAAVALHEALGHADRAGLPVSRAQLKTPLRGLPADAPHPELTRHKHLTVTARIERPAWLASADASGEIRARFDAARPVSDWLNAHVGPPNR